MATITFDTHAMAKRLSKAGFKPDQVEAQITVLKEFSEGIATSQDIKYLSEQHAREIQNVENRLTLKLGSLENRLVLKLGALVVATLTAAVTLVALVTKIL